MGSADEEFRQLRQLLERAALDAALWRDVCDALASFLGGVGASLVPEDVGLSGPWITASPALSGVLEQVFREGWHLRNLRRKSIPIIKQRGYATDLDIVDAAAMRREPFYIDLLGPWRLAGGDLNSKHPERRLPFRSAARGRFRDFPAAKAGSAHRRCC